MIQVEKLTKYYGTKLAVDNISFTVKKGEILGFLGPNGAGKSTTMKIITGFLSPTEGTVKVDGFDGMRNDMEMRRRIGYLPEHPPLYYDMTVKNYLEFAAQIRGVAPKSVKPCVESIVERCGLTKYYRSQCSSLSKGYRQRVGIAQAMVHSPKVLVLDEPTIGLDPIQIVEIRELIKSFAGKHTVILSTHILPEVEMTCERVIIINEGKIVAEDSTVTLRDGIDGSLQLLLTVTGSSEGLKDILEKIKGIKAVSEEKTGIGAKFTIGCNDSDKLRPVIADSVIKSGYKLFEMRNITTTLEDAFIKVTLHK